MNSVNLAIVDFFDDLSDSQPLCFDDFGDCITANNFNELSELFTALSDYSARGYYAVGFITYEAARYFDSALKTRRPDVKIPLAEFAIAKNPCSAARRQKYLDEAGSYQFEKFQPAWDHALYNKKITKAIEHISAGDTYQINLTFPLESTFSGDCLGCYKKISAMQRAKYCGCYLSEKFKIISASPELFFARSGQTITTKPMKGTRRRGNTNAEDIAIALQLAESPKDRAENSMIVDLLRNDLGRICRGGSVKVSNTFNCEKYPTLWQMTSTVKGELSDGTELADIFKAIFPCGSVTGAPKIKTTEIITQLEHGPRGVYCGAFGAVLPGGDCVFNVPIRTLTIYEDNSCVYNVGSGVVADSESLDEYEECILKAKVLSGVADIAAVENELQILETMLFTPEEGFYLLEEHLHRMEESAQYFEYSFNKAEALSKLKIAVFDKKTNQRVRLLLNRQGDFIIQCFDLAPINSDEKKILHLASEPIDSINNPFVYHKTTNRAHYDYFRNQLDENSEMLLYNKRGEITEGTITNVAIKLNGKWITPKLSCGLLPGLARRQLLNTGQITEGIITLKDLKNAQAIKLFNSITLMQGWASADCIYVG